jgi:hypothetical protein
MSATMSNGEDNDPTPPRTTHQQTPVRTDATQTDTEPPPAWHPDAATRSPSEPWWCRHGTGVDLGRLLHRRGRPPLLIQTFDGSPLRCHPASNAATRIPDPPRPTRHGRGPAHQTHQIDQTTSTANLPPMRPRCSAALRSASRGAWRGARGASPGCGPGGRLQPRRNAASGPLAPIRASRSASARPMKPPSRAPQHLPTPQRLPSKDRLIAR